PSTERDDFLRKSSRSELFVEHDLLRKPVPTFRDHAQAKEDLAMQITWYGHAAFRLDFGGKAVLIDPFFTGNPAFVSDKAAAIKGVTNIVLTHGHGDHVGDTLDIARQNGATVTTNYDLCMWLAAQGLEKFNPMNTGGTTDLDGFTVTMVRADHSSGD